MNKRGMGFLSLALLLLALTIGAVVTMGDVSIEKIYEIKDNLTIEHINFTESELSPELSRALEHWVNGVIQAYVELMKWTMGYAAEHPEIPYKGLIWLVLISLMAPIIVALFKLLVIVLILTREFLQGRKDKRELKRIKQDE